MRLVAFVGVGMGAVILACGIISGQVVSRQWQTYDAVTDAQAAAAVTQSALAVATLVSKERGPANSVLGNDLPIPQPLTDRLIAARQETDQGFDHLSEILARSSYSHREEVILSIQGARSHLARARADIDRLSFFPSSQRTDGAITAAVEGMIAVIPDFAPGLNVLEATLARSDPALANYVVIARLATEMRDDAGRLGSVFAAPLSLGRPLTVEESSHIEHLAGMIDGLDLQIKLTQLKAKEDSSLRDSLLAIEQGYFGDGNTLIGRVLRAGRAGESYGMTMAEFTRDYVPAMGPMVELRDIAVQNIILRVERQMEEARQALILNAMAALLAIIMVVLVFVLIRRRVSDPLAQISLTLRAMETGRTDLIIPRSTRQDEIGDVLRAVKAFYLTLMERQRAQEALREEEEKLRGLYELSPLGIALADINGRYVEFNDAFRRITGYETDELLCLDPGILVPVQDEEEEAWQQTILRNTGHYGPYEKQCLRKDGTTALLEWTGILVTGRDGRPYVWSIVEDIGSRKQVEEQLRIAATAFESQEGMVVTDAETKILRVNRAFTEITGYSAQEAVGRKTNLLKSSHHDAPFYMAIWASLRNHGGWSGEIWNRCKNGAISPHWLTLTAVKDVSGKVTHYVASLTDITLRKAAEDEIKHLAFYDPLTQLPNRRLLLDRLQHALASCARSDRNGAILFIDLDNFKALNDTLGHDVGDQLLVQVAQRLSACVREGDTVARLGGDEFVVMLEDLGLNQQDPSVQAEVVGEKILITLNQPYSLGDRRYHSTPSIGVALFNSKQNSIEEVLKQADLAMYQAKSDGRNSLRFFDPEMQALVLARTELEADLRQGLEKDQFILFYQAQVNDLGQVVGVEALLRWQHPRRGLMAPIEFIPAAEDSGLILPLGRWVLEAACAQMVVWMNRPGGSNLTLSVNVSARQFRSSDFVPQVLNIFEQTGVDPHRIKFELTESLFVEDVEGVAVKMFALKGRGVGFSLDDFGTGYSSLRYLKQLPLDELKIDKSFVRDVLTDPNDAAIARTIIALGDSLGLKVVAEGVETIEQKDFIARHGCCNYQGYLFARPVPVAEFEAFWRARPSAELLM